VFLATAPLTSDLTFLGQSTLLPLCQQKTQLPQRNRASLRLMTAAWHCAIDVMNVQ